MSSSFIAAGRAFDALAESYQSSFTDSLIGRAQRNSVWDELVSTFVAGDHLLELNCGTGEDAIFLARRGSSLVCCDASNRMIEVAQRRLSQAEGQLDVSFHLLPTENLRFLETPEYFDGVLSNFSGLNCVENLARVAQDLAAITRPDAKAVLCLSTRFCLWETIFYGLKGQFAKAARRWSGSTQATINGMSIPLRYPTIFQLKTYLSPWFRLRQIKGIGIFVPPSYVEPWARQYPAILRCAERIDRVVAAWPVFRIVGDHMLLILERTTV